MNHRRVTYRLYPNASQAERLEEIRGLHCRLYNTALEERIRVYRETGKGLTYFDQQKELTKWRKGCPALAGVNAQSEQSTLRRLDLAFKHFFRRVKNGETPGFPRFKSASRYPGWGYTQWGWKFIPGEDGKNGHLYLQSVGNVQMRGRPRNEGEPVTCDIMLKGGKWYASVVLKVEEIERDCGSRVGAFDWGLKEYLTIATEDGVETFDNPRHLRNQLAELKRLNQSVSRKIRTAQRLSGKQKGFAYSKSLKRSIRLLANLYAKIANQRKDFLHKLSAWLVSEFGAIGTEALTVKNMVRNGGSRKKGLNREIMAAAPSAFLNMVKVKAEEAGAWFEVAHTQTLKPTQRCHSCWKLPDVKKTLDIREHECPHCGTSCDRDENAAKVLLRWLNERLAGKSGSGEELAESWSGVVGRVEAQKPS